MEELPDGAVILSDDDDGEGTGGTTGGASGSTGATAAATATSRKTIEALEIEDGVVGEDDELEQQVDNETFDEDDIVDNDLEELLPTTTTRDDPLALSTAARRRSGRPNSSSSLNNNGGIVPLWQRLLYSNRCLRCCCGAAASTSKPERVGNMTIFMPGIFRETGWGIIGPHWFGPVCVLGLIAFAGSFFIHQSYQEIGIGSAAICILFTFATTYNLVDTAFRDPGVVALQPHADTQPSSSSPSSTDKKHKKKNREESDYNVNYRWCDVCQVSQVSVALYITARDAFLLVQHALLTSVITSSSFHIAADGGALSGL